MDDLTKRGPQDRSRISLTEGWEVLYWCGALDVDERQLREAVQKAGNMVDDVRRHLGLD